MSSFENDLPPWLGSKPSGWALRRAKTIFSHAKVINTHRDETNILSLTLRGVVRNDPDAPEGLVPSDYATYQIFEPGDLVFKLIDLENIRTSRVGLVPERGIMSSAYIRLRSHLRVDTRYFYYQFYDLYQRHVFNELGNGVRSTIGAQDLLELRLLYPPPHDQEAIADYLDRETTRIDALIAAKRHLVEVLKERLAVYTRKILMSTSPALHPLKRTWQVVDCKHRTPTYVESGYPVISPGDATPGRLDISRAHRFVSQDDYQDLTGGGRQPKVGDIVYSRNASIGIAAFVDTDAPFCMGQDVCLISSEHASQLYLTYFLNSLGLDQLEEQKLGSTFSRVNIAQILDLIVPTPSPDEQRRIAQHLDETTALYRTLVSNIETQVVLLREKAQALVTAAVTGQVEALKMA